MPGWCCPRCWCRRGWRMRSWPAAPVTGLYTSILCLIGYAVFGPSRVLVLGPDSSLGPMIAATIAPLLLSGGDPARAVALASMLAVIVGVVMVVAGLAGFGFVADLLSKPTQIGYMNGLALTIIIGQLPKLFGFSTDANGLVAETSAFLSGLFAGEANRTAALIGVTALAGILLTGSSPRSRASWCRGPDCRGGEPLRSSSPWGRHDRRAAAGPAHLHDPERHLGDFPPLVLAPWPSPSSRSPTRCPRLRASPPARASGSRQPGDDRHRGRQHRRGRPSRASRSAPAARALRSRTRPAHGLRSPDRGCCRDRRRPALRQLAHAVRAPTDLGAVVIAPPCR